MVQTRSIEDEKVTERRAGGAGRRVNDERRNLARLSYMKPDCRSSVPRRQSDVDSTISEGELWWSSSQQFY